MEKRQYTEGAARQAAMLDMIEDGKREGRTVYTSLLNMSPERFGRLLRPLEQVSLNAIDNIVVGNFCPDTADIISNVEVFQVEGFRYSNEPDAVYNWKFAQVRTKSGKSTLVGVPWSTNKHEYIKVLRHGSYTQYTKDEYKFLEKIK